MGIMVGSYPPLSQLPHSKATPRTLDMGPPVCLNTLRRQQSAGEDRLQPECGAGSNVCRWRPGRPEPVKGQLSLRVLSRGEGRRPSRSKAQRRHEA